MDIINENIRLRETILIDKDGTNLGKLPMNKARELTSLSKLDIVLVSKPMPGKPAVCRIMDYHKVQFQKKKNAKKADEIISKEIQFGAEIAAHDLETRAKTLLKWTEKNKVRVMIRVKMMGRMVTRPEYALDTFNRFLELIKDSVVIDKAPEVVGRDVIAYVRSK